MSGQVLLPAAALALIFFAAADVSAQDITLATNASGITIGGIKPSWSTGFGSVNGLGLGTPGTGETILAVSGGVLYTAPYNIVVTANNGHRAVVRAYVSTNFAHSAVLQVYGCVSSCTSAPTNQK